SPCDLYCGPATRFVAEFFGTPRINGVPARVLGLPGGDLVGVRPEQLEVLAGSTRGALEATVEQAELTGSEVWVTLTVGGESMIARAPSDFAALPGARVWVRFPADRVLRFDDETRGAAQRRL